MRLSRFHPRSAAMAILLASAGMAYAPAGHAQGAQRPGDEQADGGVAQASPRYEIAVEGMRCAFCAFGLERKLRTLEGVEQVKVRLRDARVEVMLAPDAALSPDAVARVVEEAGFAMGGLEMRVRGLVSGSGDRLTFVLGRGRFGLREGGGFAGLRKLVESGTRDVMLTAHVHRSEEQDGKTTLAVVAAEPAEPEPPEDDD